MDRCTHSESTCLSARNSCPARHYRYHKSLAPMVLLRYDFVLVVFFALPVVGGGYLIHGL